MLGPAHLVFVAHQAGRPEQIHAQLVDPLVDLREHELGDGALWARVAGLAVLRGPQVGQAQDLRLGPEPQEPVALGWDAVDNFVAPDTYRFGDGAATSSGGAGTATDAGAFVHQGRHRHPPALADVADPIGIGDAYVGQ